jgi:hypothetical protein
MTRTAIAACVACAIRELTGGLTKNNSVFLEGKGGSADFVLVATQTGKDHYRCFRRFEVKQRMKLWGTDVPPGTYFATTEVSEWNQASSSM